MKVNVGFIGFGKLGSAIATGLSAAPGYEGKIFAFEPFDRTAAQTLRERYPKTFFISDSPEDLLARVEIVFPTVFPDVLPAVTAGLPFSAVHRVVHVAAGIDLSEAKAYYGNAGKVLRAVPLPFASRRMGPMLLFGDDADCEALFRCFGSLIKVDTERELEILAVHTALMVPYYAIVNEVVEWSMKKGMACEKARDYLCFMNSALSDLIVQEDVRDIGNYLKSIATAGGTNEEAHRILTENDAYSPWQTAMESVGRRYGL